MIRIIKGQNNVMRLTLAEKTTLEMPFYLFVFKSDVTQQEKIFTVADTSRYRYRYNQFLITETAGAEDLSSGVVSFNPTGFWEYKVYEMADSSNLSIANITGLVEQGRAKVIGEETSRKKYQNSRNYKAYGKGS